MSSSGACDGVRERTVETKSILKTRSRGQLRPDPIFAQILEAALTFALPLPLLWKRFNGAPVSKEHEKAVVDPLEVHG